MGIVKKKVHGRRIQLFRWVWRSKFKQVSGQSLEELLNKTRRVAKLCVTEQYKTVPAGAHQEVREYMIENECPSQTQPYQSLSAVSRDGFGALDTIDLFFGNAASSITNREIVEVLRVAGNDRHLELRRRCGDYDTTEPVAVVDLEEMPPEEKYFIQHAIFNGSDVVDLVITLQEAEIEKRKGQPRKSRRKKSRKIVVKTGTGLVVVDGKVYRLKLDHIKAIFDRLKGPTSPEKVRKIKKWIMDKGYDTHCIARVFPDIES